MLSAQVWMRACRSLELSPQAPATKQRSSPKPCSLATKAPVSPGGVPLTSLSSFSRGRRLGAGKFSCSPDCLLLCFACRISRDPGGHCFYFAKSVCDTIRRDYELYITIYYKYQNKTKSFNVYFQDLSVLNVSLRDSYKSRKY